MDFGNERRRDTWLAIIKELQTAYWFISEYGPKENDPLVNYMDGSKQGRKRTITSAANSIARLQVCLFSLLTSLLTSLYDLLESGSEEDQYGL